jgi:hypothetical protein
VRRLHRTHRPRIRSSSQKIFPRGSGEPLDAEGCLTVDDLFDALQDAIAYPADSLEVEYDEAFGCPRRVAIDFVAAYAADEITYLASELVALPEPRAGMIALAAVAALARATHRWARLSRRRPPSRR